MRKTATSSPAQRRRIVREATRLLRLHGLTATGRKRGEVSQAQQRFERRLIATPMNGQPRK